MSLVLSFALGGAPANDLSRLIDMHYPETTYVLLKNAHSKAQA